ncbi:hypothetical protein L1987_26416 [Smallanthus sonchifolius]|uniref:Uncharacterized protein n=1 Tax=Smallanthus sonchifolius TaxID=185202 RepID=A0ACB9IAZ8_9ASTR|nr:hypothetical protein L1987_26416 [Smallanthus sonchifolius]
MVSGAGQTNVGRATSYGGSSVTNVALIVVFFRHFCDIMCSGDKVKQQRVANHEDLHGCPFGVAIGVARNNPAIAIAIAHRLRTERRSDEPGKHVTSAVRIKNHCSSHVAFKDGGVQVQIMWMCSCFCISFLAVAKVTYPSNKTYTTDTTLAAFKRNH